MTESKFTPGPWVARYDDRVSLPDDTDGTKSIAHVYGRKGQPYAQAANQALIAAAPALYEALRKLLVCYENAVTQLYDAPTAQSADVAIAARAALTQANGTPQTVALETTSER